MVPSTRILLIWLFFFSSTSLFSQWTTYAPMPGTRWAHVCVGSGGKLYALAGSVGPTYEYNPGTNTWATLASIPTLRSYPGVAEWNGKIYVLGGSVGAAWSAKNECYDIATNTWTTLADMPVVRTTTAAAAVNGRIYVMNGWNGANMTAVDVYDIATNTWSIGVAAPTARSHAKTAVVNNKIYLIAGYGAGWVNTVEVFDPLLNTWQTLAPMPTGRYIHAVGEIGNSIYVAGGYIGSASNNLEIYDIGSNSWSPGPPMPTARYRTDGASVGSCFYVLGGFNGSNLANNEGFCAVVLPVELQLTGWISGSGVELSWVDPNESEANVYKIERSKNRTDFEEIGHVFANPSKTEPLKFHDPLPQGGTNFYRIQRIDRAGNMAYSSAIRVELKGEDEFTAGWVSQSSSISIRWESEFWEGPMRFELLDLSGRILVHRNLPEILSGQSEFLVPVKQPASGLYLIRLFSGNRTITKRIWITQ